MKPTIEIPKIGEIYQHYKNKHLYEIKAVGRMSGDDTVPMVAYRALYKEKDNNYDTWFRTLEEFTDYVVVNVHQDEVDYVPRFQRVV